MQVDGLIRGTGLIFQRSFKELICARSTLLFVCASLLYVFVSGLVLHFGGDREDQNKLFSTIGIFVFLQGIVPLTAIYFSISTIRDEISQGTIVYLIASPLPRASLWLGKYLAAVFVCELILVAGMTLAWLVSQALAAEPRVGGELRTATFTTLLTVVAIAPLVFCAVGTMLGILYRRAMMLGAFFVLGWESLVSFTPSQAGIRELTISDSLRTLIYHLSVDNPGLRSVLKQASMSKKLDIPGTADALQVLAIFALSALAIGIVFGGRKDFEIATKE